MMQSVRTQTLMKLIGLAVLGVILRHADFSLIAEILASCRIEYLLVAISLFIFSAFLKATRWHLIMRSQGIEYALTESFKRYLVGLFLGTVTPGRLGELSRSLYVKRDLQIPLGTIFSGVVADRVFDFFFLLVVGLSGAYHFHLAKDASVFFLIAAVMLLIVPILVIQTGTGHRLLDRGLTRFSRTKLSRFGGGEPLRFAEGFKDIVHPRCFGYGLLTALAYAVFFAAGFLLTRALQIDITFQDASLALAAANLLSLVPVTVAGVGTRDAMLVLTLGTVNIPAEAALAFSVLILFCSYFGTGIFGFFFFMADKPPKS